MTVWWSVTNSVVCPVPALIVWVKPGLSESRKMEDEGGGYRWETGYEKTWEAITEDGDGLLEVSVQDVIHRARRKRLAERQGRNKLGMMRHLYLLIGG